MSEEDAQIDPSKRVPKGLDNTDKIFGYSRSEITIIVICLFAGMLMSEYVPVQYQSFSPLLLIGGVVFGLLIVFVTPSHLEPTEWLGSINRFIWRPKTVPHVSLSDGMAREQKDYIEETSVYQLNERTQEVTRVKQIHKDAQAIERVDGAVIGAVKVDPTNMAKATSDKWEELIESWQDYLDHTLEYPAQIYCTSTEFSVGSYLDHYQSRLNSPSLQSRPIMQEVLRDFLTWYPTTEYLEHRGMYRQDYYIIFAVKEDEILGSDLQQQGVVEQLSDLPVIGDPIQSFFGGGSDRSESEIKAKQFATLHSRIHDARNLGIRKLPGCDSRRVSGFELAVLLKEYWEGREVSLEDERAINQHGVSYRSDEPPVTEENYASTNDYDQS